MYLRRLWGPIVALNIFSINGVNKQRLCCVCETETVFVDVIRFMKTFDQEHFDGCSKDQILVSMRAELSRD